MHTERERQIDLWNTPLNYLTHRKTELAHTGQYLTASSERVAKP